MSVVKGKTDEDLEMQKVGPIVHSRWLTLACRVVRFYMSTKNPSTNLLLVTKFCVLVYFPSWFEIKCKNKITDGSRNLFIIVKRIKSVPDEKVAEIALSVIQNNAFFAHPENILLSMLGDEEKRIRKLAVDRILCLRFLKSQNQDKVQEEDTVRKFLIPQIDTSAKSYHKLSDINSEHVKEPPLTQDLSNEMLKEIVTSPLSFHHPCHSQAVERHIRRVSEASGLVSTFARRDGLIRQRIRSRKLVNRCETKRDFEESVQ